VLGRVNKPGEFQVPRPVDVMQALAMAGGLTPFADREAIRVLRRDGEAQQVMPFNYEQVERGEALEQNILLRAGDLIMVP